MCSRKEELEKNENEKKAEKERQGAVERQARLLCQQEDDRRRQKIAAKLEEIQRREIKENLKVIIICALICIIRAALTAFCSRFIGLLLNDNDGLLR